MGNQKSKNDDFSSNPNFNMNAHRSAMQNLGANYSPADLSMPQNYGPNIKVEQTEFKKINRTCSIYKPTFHIFIRLGYFNVEFQYDAEVMSKLDIYIGVIDVQQDPQTMITTNIRSKLHVERQLPAGKKQKFKIEQALDGISESEASSLILRLMSPVSSEVTEYSLKKMKEDHWKVLLEKFQFNGTVTQLENIYKGDETNECIICLTETSNTLIEPCNHLCLCKECLSSVIKSTNKCPICRKSISTFKVIINN